jgi:hypothetical protein
LALSPGKTLSTRTLAAPGGAAADTRYPEGGMTGVYL